MRILGSSRSLAILTGGLLCFGCAGRQGPPVVEPPAFESSPSGYSDEGASLFKGDSAVLSDSDINRILSFDFTLRPKNRLAVLPLGTDRLWSEEYAKLDSDNTEAFLDRLRTARTITMATQLPLLLVPEKKTVPLLREAAARFQADLLVIYQTRVRTFSRLHALSKDEVKALCIVEAVVLDVRTGIVPYTTAASETIVAKRSQDDFNFSETVAKVTGETVGKALRKIADDMVTYLNR